MRVVGVIPSRWASTRFPGKSLAPVCGKPLIQWVVERCRQARRLDDLVVATDDDRIRKAVEGFGGRAVMTRSDHPSGTDRVAEAVRRDPADVVVNIQGDEPLMDPDLIDRLVEVILSNLKWDMATAVSPLAAADAGSVTINKVVMDAEDCALYFSRAAIPHIRDRDFHAAETVYWQHIGIYVYRTAFLFKLVAEPPCLLERAECLEQLRALYLGGRIKVLKTRYPGIGVDAPADVPVVETILRSMELA